MEIYNKESKQWELKDYSQLRCNDIYKIEKDNTVYQPGTYVCLQTIYDVKNSFNTDYIVKANLPFQSMNLLDAYIITEVALADGYFLFPSEVLPLLMDGKVIDTYSYKEVHQSTYYKDKRDDIQNFLVAISDVQTSKELELLQK